MKPRVRIYIPTYQRPKLLERALDSLLGQTFQDWVAEVHNDDPGDTSAGELVNGIGDSRILLVDHQTNWGAMRAFNNIFSGRNSEEFISLLEDDNAWEAGFLERMLEIMDANPEIKMAWCNQALDRETPEGNVVQMDGRNARERGQPSWLSSGKYSFGHVRQASGALFANGAMLLRTKLTGPLQTPLTIPFTGVESYRERLMGGPFFYTEEPLARFTETQASARVGEKSDWSKFQAGLMASYLLSRPESDSEVLEYLRSLRPASTGVFIVACLAHPDLRSKLTQIRPQEWLRWGLTAARRYSRVRDSLLYQSASWWNELCDATNRNK